MSVNANQIQKEEAKKNRRDSFLAFLLTLLITSGVFVLLWFFVIYMMKFDYKDYSGMLFLFLRVIWLLDLFLDFEIFFLFHF